MRTIAKKHFMILGMTLISSGVGEPLELLKRYDAKITTGIKPETSQPWKGLSAKVRKTERAKGMSAKRATQGSFLIPVEKSLMKTNI